MPISDFRVVESIGKGSFASVYKVVRKSDNKLYALKRVKIGKMSKREVQDALNEIRFLASLRHKNIVAFLESFLENNDTELCIIMEVWVYPPLVSFQRSYSIAVVEICHRRLSDTSVEDNTLKKMLSGDTLFSF